MHAYMLPFAYCDSLGVASRNTTSRVRYGTATVRMGHEMYSGNGYATGRGGVIAGTTMPHPGLLILGASSIPALDDSPAEKPTSVFFLAHMTSVHWRAIIAAHNKDAWAIYPGGFETPNCFSQEDRRKEKFIIFLCSSCS